MLWKQDLSVKTGVGPLEKLQELGSSLPRDGRRRPSEAGRGEQGLWLRARPDGAFRRGLHLIFPVALRDRSCCPRFADEGTEAQREK